MSRKYSDKALRSFFGARVGGQDRPQDVNTPVEYIRAILKLWPEGIEYDPCGSFTDKIESRIKVFPPLLGYLDHRSAGLIGSWPDRTFANPPFKHLRHWMGKPETSKEHLLLCPVRPLRKWWRYHARRATSILWMNPLAFDGHKQMFPAPLCTMYYGKRLEMFDRAFEDFGETGRFI